MFKAEKRKTGSSREYGEIKLLTTDEKPSKNIGNNRQMTTELRQASSIKHSGHFLVIRSSLQARSTLKQTGELRRTKKK